MDPIYFLAAALGLCVGSFLNVLISRLPDPNRRLFHPSRSQCPRCERMIPAAENIPVLSYLWLRGRCRGCGMRISWVYPAVEVLGAAIVLYAYAVYGLSVMGLLAITFLLLLLAIAVTDAQTFLIPDIYTLGGAVAGISFSGWAMGWPEAFRHLADALLVGGGLYIFGFAVGRVLGKEALGFGDVLMVGMMAAFLGFGATMVAIYIAAVSGVLTYVVLHKKNIDRLIPLGLHLSVGGAVVFIFGATSYAPMLNSILPWY